MSPNSLIVASVFRTAGIVIAVPAALAFLFFGAQTLLLRMNSTKPRLTVTGNDLIDLGMAAAYGMAKIFSCFTGAVSWVMTLLTGVALVLLALAAGAFYTAQGLSNGAPWAHLAALVVLVLAGFISLVITLSVRGLLRVLGLGLVAGVGYLIWMLQN